MEPRDPKFLKPAEVFWTQNKGIIKSQNTAGLVHLWPSRLHHKWLPAERGFYDNIYAKVVSLGW